MAFAGRLAHSSFGIFIELRTAGPLGSDLRHGPLDHSAAVEVKGAKKRVLSPAGRAAIAKAAKKRWAKVKKEAKKAVS